MIGIVKTQYRRAKELYLRYERVLMPATLVIGFIADYLTFKNIQISTALAVLTAHFVLAGLSIGFIHAYDSGRVPQKLRYARLFAPLAVQFTFGALLGASLIFYWFSGALSVSWPLMLVIAFLMVSNDVFRAQVARPVVQISVYAFIAISFFSILFAFVFNSLSAWVFPAAGIAGFLFVYAYTGALARLNTALQARRQFSVRCAFGVFLAMAMLYALNIMPPIPLSLREAGVYHSIKNSGGTYVLAAEHEGWWERLLPGARIRLAPGERAFVYSAIFAPADLRTAIVHRWQWYDENAGAWVEKDRLSFGVRGGRHEGYRGYSVKSDIPAGDWRVSVETMRGQVMGRIRFSVEKVAEVPALYELRR